MAEQTCPGCGTDLPEALGQHAEDLVTGLVTCPTCGASVTLREGPDDEPASGDFERAEAAPPGRTEGTDSFSGQETMQDLAEELKDKPS